MKMKFQSINRVFHMGAFLVVIALGVSQGKAAGAEKAENKTSSQLHKVQNPQSSKPGSKWVFTFEQFSALSEEQRIDYLEGVREILEEFERSIVSSKTSAGGEVPPPRIYSQLDALYELFGRTPAQAADAQMEGPVMCFKNGSGLKRRAVRRGQGWDCGGGDWQAFRCPDGGVPRRIMTGFKKEWSAFCIGTGGKVPAIPVKPAPPLVREKRQVMSSLQTRKKSAQRPNRQPSSQAQDSSGSREARGTVVEGASSTSAPVTPDTGTKTADTTLFVEVDSRTPQAEAPSTDTPAPFNEEDYDVENSRAAGDAWAFIDELKKECPINVLDKASCDARPNVRAEGGCLIAGVRSRYGEQFCEPIRKLCYDDGGGMQVNEACNGRKDAFECGPGKTVCNPLLGFRDAKDRISENDRTFGAFCAPISGRGAKSATAVCIEWNRKYERSKLGRSNARDFLLVADQRTLENIWGSFRRDLYELCDDDVVSKRNCEACQILKLRLAILAKKVMGARQCRAPDEISTLREPTKSTKPPANEDRFTPSEVINM